MKNKSKRADEPANDKPKLQADTAKTDEQMLFGEKKTLNIGSKRLRKLSDGIDSDLKKLGLEAKAPKSSVD